MFKELSGGISRVKGSAHVKEPYHVRGNGLTNLVISQPIVVFVERGMRDGATGDHTLVITKHICFAIKRNSHHPKSVLKVHDLFSSNACSNEFGPISGSLNSLLVFGQPFNSQLWN